MKSLIFLIVFAAPFLELVNCKGCGCIFDGCVYTEGQKIRDVCFELTCVCVQGIFHWKSINNGIDSECSMCTVFNDPHFRTFDSYFYDWHGTNNYSLVQPNSRCCTYDPPFGVFGKFKGCGRASCLGTSTYKADHHTIVQIEHDYVAKKLQIKVNNGLTLSPIPEEPENVWNYPLIIWKDDPRCVNIQGPTLSLIVCPHAMFIFAPNNLRNQLFGLCGTNTLMKPDEHTRRDGGLERLISRNPTVFANSWEVPADVARKEDCYREECQPACTSTTTSTPKETTTSTSKLTTTSTPKSTTTSITTSTTTSIMDSSSDLITTLTTKETPSTPKSTTTSTPGSIIDSAPDSITTLTPNVTTTSTPKSTTTSTPKSTTTSTPKSTTTSTPTSTTPYEPLCDMESAYFEMCKNRAQQNSTLVNGLDEELLQELYQDCASDLCNNSEESERWMNNLVEVILKIVDVIKRMRQRGQAN